MSMIRRLGYVVNFKNAADTGKTLGMVAVVNELLKKWKWEIIANFPLYLPGVKVVDNTGIRTELFRGLDFGLRHRIYAVDEADLVFPGRGFSNEKQTRNLLGAFQMTKLESWLLWAEHEGSAITDKLLRLATQIGVVPNYDKYTDILTMTVVDGVDRVVFPLVAEHASLLFRRYKRWEPVRESTINRKYYSQGSIPLK